MRLVAGCQHGRQQQQTELWIGPVVKVHTGAASNLFMGTAEREEEKKIKEKNVGKRMRKKMLILVVLNRGRLAHLIRRDTKFDLSLSPSSGG